MKLSAHFTLEAMVRTEVRGMQEANLYAAQEFIPVLKRVCDDLLEPVRALFYNAPVNIHSGFRCAALNQAVGGSPTSQHMAGEAADFDVDGQLEASELQNALHVIMASKIEFRQLLIENGCLHISLPTEEGPNGEVAHWDKGVKVIIRAGA